MTRQSSRQALIAPVLAAFSVLAACATPQRLPPGTSRQAALAHLGAPVERHALAAGAATERWVYPSGGINQETWMVDFDAAGRVLQVRQALTFDNFMRVRSGVDTEADVRREFGPPRMVQQYARVNLVAWLYAYKEAGVWNSEMAIYFDPQGIVRKVENGPDPRFLGPGDRDQ